MARVGRAGAVEDSVEFEQTLAVGTRGKVGGRFGPGGAVLAGAQFVEQFAEAVAIRRWRARVFEWNVAGGARERVCFICSCHEANVRQLRHATNEDDVGRFHVAMYKFVCVQVRQRAGERVGDFKAAVDGQSTVLLEFGAERVRRVQ